MRGSKSTTALGASAALSLSTSAASYQPWPRSGLLSSGAPSRSSSNVVPDGGLGPTNTFGSSSARWASQSAGSLVGNRRGRVTNYLEGMTSEIKVANTQHDDNHKQVSNLEQRKARAAIAAANQEELGAEQREAIHRGIEGLGSSLDKVKQFHDKFEPLSKDQQKKLDQARSDKSGVPQRRLLSRKEFDAWKYGRRMEPPLPKLVPLGGDVAPKEVPDQTLVEFNSIIGGHKDERLSAEAYKPASRQAVIKAKAAERDVHIREVRCRQKERKTQMLADKVAKGQKSAGISLPGAKTTEAEEPPKDDRLRQWLVSLAAARFAAKLFEETMIRNMTPGDRLAYVSNPDNLERLTRLSGNDSESLLGQTILLAQCSTEVAWTGREQFTKDFVKTRLRRIHARKDARVIHTCLMDWKIGGRMLYSLLRFAGKIKHMQRWYRDRKSALDQTIEGLSKTWLKLEKADLEIQLKAEDHKLSAKDRGVQLSMEARIENRMLLDKTRMDFLTNEYRACRWKSLPAVALYQASLKTWQANLKEWKETRSAMKVINAEATQDDILLIPPTEPRCKPKEEDIMQMIVTARKHRYGGGWTKLDFTGGGNSSGRRKSEKDETVAQAALPSPRAEARAQAELVKLGLGRHTLPGFHGQKPRQNAGFGGPLACSSPTPTPRGMFDL